MPVFHTSYRKITCYRLDRIVGEHDGAFPNLQAYTEIVVRDKPPPSPSKSKHICQSRSYRHRIPCFVSSAAERS